MTWNSSPLRLNHRAEISSPSALAQWTEHRKACTETARRFFCAAVAACFTYIGRHWAGWVPRWPKAGLWEVADLSANGRVGRAHDGTCVRSGQPGVDLVGCVLLFLLKVGDSCAANRSQPLPPATVTKHGFVAYL